MCVCVCGLLFVLFYSLSLFLSFCAPKNVALLLIIHWLFSMFVDILFGSFRLSGGRKAILYTYHVSTCACVYLKRCRFIVLLKMFNVK